MPKLLDAIQYYHDACLERVIFEASPNSTDNERSFRLSVNPRLGNGHVDVQQFHNGILMGRMDYNLYNNHYASYRDLQPYLSLRFLLDGHFDIEIPELQLTDRITGGELWITHGSLGHTLAHTPSRENMRGISVDIPLHVLQTWQEGTLDHFPSPIQEILHNPQTLVHRIYTQHPQLEHLARRILQADNNALCSRLQLEALTLEFLAQAFQVNSSVTPQQKRQAVLDEAADILQQEWVNPPTIAQLARRIGLNEFYLKNGFREQFGCTIGAYVRKLRMENAGYLLQKQGYSVKETALSVGFSNIGYFSTAFKQYYGELPSTYRLKGIAS